MSRDYGRREPKVVRADFLVELRGFELMAIASGFLGNDEARVADLTREALAEGISIGAHRRTQAADPEILITSSGWWNGGFRTAMRSRPAISTAREPEPPAAGPGAPCALSLITPLLVRRLHTASGEAHSQFG